MSPSSCRTCAASGVMILALLAWTPAAHAQTPLQNGVSVRALTGAAGSERHYRIAVPSGTTQLRIQISGGSGDCDLYVKRGAPPTRNAWDYRPFSSTNNETVVVANPATGDWYIMLRGYRPYSGVTLVGAYQASPPPPPPPSLQTLQNGQPVAGLSGSAGSRRLCKIPVPSGQSSLQFTTSGGSGDCDLYVKLGPPTTADTWGYRSISGTNNETITIPNPAAGEWYILLYGYGAYSGLTLQASYRSEPPPPPVTLLQTDAEGYATVGSLAGSTNSKRYYRIPVPAGRARLRIQIYNDDPYSGDCDVYIKFGSIPAVGGADYSSYRPGNMESVTIPSPSAGDWYVMLVGYSSYSAVTLAVSHLGSYGNGVWYTVDGPAGERHMAGLLPLTSGSMVNSRRTWLVVHGRNSNPDRLRSLAEAMDGYQRDDQVLLLDWEPAAYCGQGLLSTRGSRWIQPVASRMAAVLQGMGLAGATLNIVGHSWGSYVGWEIAKNLATSGGVHGFVALDPAIQFPGSYSAQVHFASHTQSSWAFHSSDLGSSGNSTTADESFVVRFESFIGPVGMHRAVVDVFERLVAIGNANSGDLRLGQLLGPRPNRPWVPNMYTFTGERTGLALLFEAVVVARSQNGRQMPKLLRFVPPPGRLSTPETRITLP
ncbi:MAG: pre-peptidase C-terminal domain-containing protein [Planctomycetes bacterium]|nr:pre-peptidase C-terminal domain-containing protein [Planctomycetota bacterium]